MTSKNNDYLKLHALSRKTHLFQGIESLISWDQETYMPAGASSIRAEQIEALAGFIHKEKTSPTFSKALGKLINLDAGTVIGKDLSKMETVAVKEWYKDYRRDTALPNRFVEDFAKLTSQSIEVWKLARKDNAFHLFAPYLDKIVAMNRKKAELLGFDEHPYDALLNLYEPKATTKELRILFKGLRQSLTALLKKIASAKQVDRSFLYGKFPEAKQLDFSKKVLNAMDYDLHHGRLDVSAHPFSTSSHPTDSRITTRIHSSSLMSSISAVLHEAGHSLYEMGLSHEQYGSPLGQALSLGMHESQSRWWETRIGQSKPFWSHFLPLLKSAFKVKLDAVSLEAFYRAVNKVEPSVIRVEADEVTYCLHVLLRFELEVDLIEGSLAIRDLPEAWNAKMKELLGIEPKTLSEGCLQDVHWSMGAFGYFPTYALGNLYASHLFTGFENDFPHWEKEVAEGKLGFIKEWLSKNVYQHGRGYSSHELLKKATGKEFSDKAYMDYLTNKYKNIYKLT